MKGSWSMAGRNFRLRVGEHLTPSPLIILTPCNSIYLISTLDIILILG
jgi:hypothetical protein